MDFAGICHGLRWHMPRTSLTYATDFVGIRRTSPEGKADICTFNVYTKSGKATFYALFPPKRLVCMLR